MILRSYKGKTPSLGNPRFIAPNATIVGDVTLGDGSSVWYGAVIRSDLNPIRIGRDCNVQDNATIHSNRSSVATLGNGVTVGHNAIVHGATIEDDVLVGMHATVLDGAHIGKGSIIAAGAVVLSGMEVPPNSLVAGVPGKILRRDDPHSLERTRDNAQEYILLAEGHAESEDLT